MSWSINITQQTGASSSGALVCDPIINAGKKQVLIYDIPALGELRAPQLGALLSHQP